MSKDNQFQKEQILKGIITLLIMRFLVDKPMYGYSLQLAISEKIGRDMPQGTIYVLLKSLEKRGLIELCETQVERDRKLYSITQEGRKFLLNHETPLLIASGLMGELIEFIQTMRNQE